MAETEPQVLNAKNIIDGLADRLYDYAKLHPILAIALTEMQLNVAAILIQPDIGVSRSGVFGLAGQHTFDSRIEALAWVLANTGRELGDLVTADVAKTIIGAATSPLKAILGGVGKVIK